ncbi:MAG: 3'-5' exonuclease [Betaproteobacteria bacterium]|nr:3'-5' exonuclease [Betaproteobacteria bacterium]
MVVQRLRERFSALWKRDAGPPERWVVVDTETSGLDPQRDALLAVGAVAVDADGIRVADSFEVVLQHEAAGDAENVAIHGIGWGAQRAGTPLADAMPAFAAYVGAAPCVGFHASFDRTVLARAFAAAGAGAAPSRWLDVAELAAALHPDQHKRGERSLDDWLARYGIETASRHTAAGDALVTAELLLRLQAQAAEQGSRGFAAISRMARQHRWLGSS